MPLRLARPVAETVPALEARVKHKVHLLEQVVSKSSIWSVLEEVFL